MGVGWGVLKDPSPWHPTPLSLVIMKHLVSLYFHVCLCTIGLCSQSSIPDTLLTSRKLDVETWKSQHLEIGVSDHTSVHIPSFD